MTVNFSNKINLKASNDDIKKTESKNEVLVIENTEICHVGMNGNMFIFTKEELEESFETLNKVPLVANVTDYVDDHNVSSLNTVGWVYDPVFENDSVYATLEITHPQIIEKIKRKTTKGEREINFVSMGCGAEKLICNICGEEIYYDSLLCDSGHKVGREYDGLICGMIGEGIEFEHVALTNVPADKEAKLGKEVAIMYAKKKKMTAVDEKEKEENKQENLDEQEANKTDTPAEEEIQPSEDKLVEVLKDKMNVMESEITQLKEVITQMQDAQKGDIMETEQKEKIVDEGEAINELEKTDVPTTDKKKKKEVTDEEEIVATEEEKEEEEEKEKKVEASKFKSTRNKLVAMYKKLCTKRFGDIPTAVANSNSLSFVKSYYRIKSKKNGSAMRGNRIMAVRNSHDAQIKAAMEDRTGEGYRKVFAIAKQQKR